MTFKGPDHGRGGQGQNRLGQKYHSGAKNNQSASEIVIETAE